MKQKFAGGHQTGRPSWFVVVISGEECVWLARVESRLICALLLAPREKDKKYTLSRIQF